MTRRTPKAPETRPDPTPAAPASRGEPGNRPGVDAVRRRRRDVRVVNTIEAACDVLQGVARTPDEENELVKLLMTRQTFAREALCIAALRPAGPARVEALRSFIKTIRAPPRRR